MVLPLTSPGEGALVFVVAVADDFAVAGSDTALVGGARPGEGFGGTVTGISGKLLAPQLIIAYRAGLLCHRSFAVAAGLVAELVAGATIELHFGTCFVFWRGSFNA